MESCRTGASAKNSTPTQDLKANVGSTDLYLVVVLLFQAAALHQNHVVRLLLEHGTRYNSENIEGRSLLHVAQAWKVSADAAANEQTQLFPTMMDSTALFGTTANGNQDNGQAKQ